jgi:hypothetical protein
VTSIAKLGKILRQAAAMQFRAKLSKMSAFLMLGSPCRKASELGSGSKMATSSTHSAENWGEKKNLH